MIRYDAGHHDAALHRPVIVSSSGNPASSAGPPATVSRVYAEQPRGKRHSPRWNALYAERKYDEAYFIEMQQKNFVEPFVYYVSQRNLHTRRSGVADRKRCAGESLPRLVEGLRVDRNPEVRSMIRIVLSLLLVLQSSAPADVLRETTEAIARAATSTERQAVVVERLKARDVTHRVEPFTARVGAGDRVGQNIVASIPARQASTTLLLGAHLDRVARGQGVVDNGASCAVLLELIARFRARPLEKTAITVVFFDLEENGLLGSRNYFQSLDPKALPSMAMNLDIFGYGDTLFVTASKEGSLIASLGKAASEGAFSVRTVPMAQYPSSDHLSMARTGVETLGIALIDGTEIDAIVRRGGAAPPRILTIIHSDADTMSQIREKDVAAATSVLENTIRMLDRVN